MAQRTLLIFFSKSFIITILLGMTQLANSQPTQILLNRISTKLNVGLPASATPITLTTNTDAATCKIKYNTAGDLFKEAAIVLNANSCEVADIYLRTHFYHCRTALSIDNDCSKITAVNHRPTSTHHISYQDAKKWNEVTDDIIERCQTFDPNSGVLTYSYFRSLAMSPWAHNLTKMYHYHILCPINIDVPQSKEQACLQIAEQIKQHNQQRSAQDCVEIPETLFNECSYTG